MTLKFRDFLVESTEKQHDRDIKIYSVTNVGLLPRESKYQQELTTDYSKNKIIKKGYIVFGNSRHTLNYGVLLDNEIGSVSSAYKVFSIDKSIVLPRYIDLYLLANRAKMLHIVKPGARDNQSIDKDILFDTDIFIPEISKQKEIIRIFDTIDLINLKNKKIISLINSLMIEIYKKTFNENIVNRNDQNGNQLVVEDESLSRNEGLSEKVKFGVLSDLIEKTLGGDWGKDTVTGQFEQRVYCVRGADIPALNHGSSSDFPLRYIKPKSFINKRLKPGDIVIEISGGSPSQSTGRSAYISNEIITNFNNELVCTNFCRAIEPINQLYSPYIYSTLQYLYNEDIFFKYENGSTGIKNFDLVRFLSGYRILIPEINTLESFERIFSRLYDKIQIIGHNIDKLNLRKSSLLKHLIINDVKDNRGE